jgi:hypothetical protein
MELSKRSESWLEKLKNTSLTDEAQALLSGKAVEVGYRATCGSTHKTMKDYEVFKKFIKALKAQGLEVSEMPVKHGNAYATNNGGFWNSYIFEIELCH